MDEGLKITLLEMPQRQALSKIMKPSKESVKRVGRKDREEGYLLHNFPFIIDSDDDHDGVIKAIAKPWMIQYPS